MYQKPWWYDLQFLRYRAWLTEIGHFGSSFAFLPPLKPEKSEFWKKWKKLLEISSFYTCTKNHNHMRYGSWDTAWDRHKFLSFLPFYPPNNPENQILEKWKTSRMSSFYTCVPKITIIWCMLPKAWSATHIIFCHFGSFFALLPHYWPLKLQFEKYIKKLLKILYFYTCVP